MKRSAASNRSWLATFLSACFLLAQVVPVLANPVIAPPPPPTPVHPTVIQHHATALPPHMPAVHPGITAPTVTGTNNLNLGSASHDFSAHQLGGFQNLVLNIGNRNVAVNLNGTQLTAAELASAIQVLTTGRQTLTLNAAGAATGGTLPVDSKFISTVTTDLGGQINSFVVPKGVHVADSVSNLAVSGNLMNYGVITANSGATLSAANTFNAAGATIAGGNGANLSLVDTNSLLNAGTISSSNSLNINTPTVVNAGTLSAARDVNFTGTGSIAVDNTGGVITAGQNVNFRDASFTANANTNLTGGTISSNQLNIYSGAGSITISEANITGVLNMTACSGHVGTNTSDLQLGLTNFSGDPLIYNYGNITLDGTKIGAQNGANLSIVASGNIVSAGGTIDTSNSNGNGGQINLIAGANFTPASPGSPGSSTILLSNSTSPGGGSLTGGLIDLTGLNGGTKAITGITSASTGGGGQGGAINLIAFAGTNANSGTIHLPTSVTINASGNGTSNGGNVTIIAGAASGAAVSQGNINAAGGTSYGSNGGTITIASARPLVPSGTSVDGVSGLNNALGYNSSNPLAGNVSVGKLQSNAGSVNVTTQGSLSFKDIDVSGGGGVASVTNGQLAGINGGTVTITAGNVTGNNIYAFGGGGAGGSFAATGGVGGNGGTVSITGASTTTGSVSLSGQVNVAGGGGGGGSGQDVEQLYGPGSGGNGGTGGTVGISVPGNIAVAGGIYAAAGATGGNGGASVFGGGATGPGVGGNGGGGGGSFGAAGGGGGAGQIDYAGSNGVGGGGGGGKLGGGGGAAMTSSSATGGNGAGFEAAGAGGQGDFNGGNGSLLGPGGNGAGASGGTGGAYAQGGRAVLPAQDGSSAINAGQYPQTVGGGNVNLTSTKGNFGSAGAPLTLVSENASLSGGAAYLTLPGNTGAGGSALNMYLNTLSISVGSGANVTAFSYPNAVQPGSVLNGTLAITSAKLAPNAGFHLLSFGNAVALTGVLGSYNNSVKIESYDNGQGDNGSLTATGNINLPGANSSIWLESKGNLTVNGSLTAANGVTVKADAMALTMNGSAIATHANGVYLYGNTTVTAVGNLTGACCANATSAGVLVDANLGTAKITGNVTAIAGSNATPSDVQLISDNNDLLLSGAVTSRNGSVLLSAQNDISQSGNIYAPKGWVHIFAANGTLTATGSVYAGGNDFAFSSKTGNGIDITVNNGINLDGNYTAAGALASVHVFTNWGPITAQNTNITSITGGVLVDAYGNNGSTINYAGNITAGGVEDHNKAIWITADQAITMKGNLTDNGLAGGGIYFSGGGNSKFTGNAFSGHGVVDMSSGAGQLSVNGHLTAGAANNSANTEGINLAAGNTISATGVFTTTGANGYIAFNNGAGPLNVSNATFNASGYVQIGSNEAVTLTNTTVVANGSETVGAQTDKGIDISAQGPLTATNFNFRSAEGFLNLTSTGNLTANGKFVGLGAGTSTIVSNNGDINLSNVTLSMPVGALAINAPVGNAIVNGSITTGVGSESQPINITATAGLSTSGTFVLYGNGQINLQSNAGPVTANGTYLAREGTISLVSANSTLTANGTFVAGQNFGSQTPDLDFEGYPAQLSGTFSASGTNGYAAVKTLWLGMTVGGTWKVSGSGGYLLFDNTNAGLTPMKLNNVQATVSGANGYIQVLSDNGHGSDIVLNGGSLRATGLNSYIDIEAQTSGSTVSITNTVLAATGTNGYINVSAGGGVMALSGTYSVTGSRTNGSGGYLQITDTGNGGAINSTARLSATGSQTYIYMEDVGNLSQNAPVTANGSITIVSDQGAVTTSTLSQTGFDNAPPQGGSNHNSVFISAGQGNLTTGMILSSGSQGVYLGSLGYPGNITSGPITGRSLLMVANAQIGSSFAPLSINTTSLTVDGSHGANVYINDTFRGDTSFNVVNGTLNNVVLTSSASILSLSGSTTQGTFSNNAGQIQIASTGLSGDYLSVTALGNITLASGGVVTVNNSISLNSKLGTVGSQSTNFSITSSQVPTISLSSAGASADWITVNSSIVLAEAKTTGDLTLSTSSGAIALTGPIASSSGSVTLTTASITPSSNASVSTAKNLTLNITNDVGSPDNYLSVKVGQVLTLQSTGSVYLNATNGIVTFSGAAANSVSNTLALANYSGSLVVNGTSGTFTGALPSALSLTAKTNLTLNASDLATSASTINWTLQAGGALTLPSGVTSINAAQDGSGNGGTISINAGSLANAPSNLALTAVGTGSGNGGVISANFTGTQNWDVTSTSATSGFTAIHFDASGPGNGGTVSLNAGGKIAVNSGLNVAGGSSLGNGGSIALTGSALTINMPLTVTGHGGSLDGNLTLVSNTNIVAGSSNNLDAGSTGSVRIVTLGTNALNIGGTSGANLIGGTITGDNVLISTSPGVNVIGSINAAGLLEFDTKSLTVSGTLAEQTLTVNSGTGSANNLTVGGSGNFGNPTSVNILAGGTLNIGANVPLTSGQASNLTNVYLLAGGALTLNTNSIVLNGGSTQVNISVNAASLSWTGKSTGPLQLNAGSNVGTPEGNVTLALSGTTALVLGNGAGQIEIFLNTPSPSASGNVSVSNGGNLTLDMNATGLVTSVGVPTNLSLLSGGTMLVADNTGANFQNMVGTGANLAFSSNSTSPFQIASGATNGIQFSGVLAANNLSITNTGAIAAISGSTVNALTINAPGTVSLNSTKQVDIANVSSGATLGSSSGGIEFLYNQTGSLSQVSGTTITSPIVALSSSTTFPAAIYVSAQNVSGSVGASGGHWNVVDTSTGAVTLGSVAAGVGAAPDGTITFQTDGPLTIGNSVSAANVNLSANGSISVRSTVGELAGTTLVASTASGTGSITGTASGLIQGLNISLQAGSGGLGTTTQALSLNGSAGQALAISTSGLVNISDQTSVTLAAVPQSVASFSLAVTGAGNALTLNGITTTSGGITASAPGGITVAGSLSSANGVTLSAGLGQLTLGTYTITANNGSVQLTGTGITLGSAGSPASISSAGGGIVLTDSGNVAGSTDVSVNSSINATGGAFQVAAQSVNVTINSTQINADSISISDTGAGGTVSVNAGAQISSAVSGITINAAGNSVSVKGTLLTQTNGDIVINGDGLTTASTASLATNNGNVTIADSGSSAAGDVNIAGTLTANGGNVNVSSSSTSGNIAITGVLQGNGINVTDATVSGSGTGVVISSTLTATNGAVVINGNANSVDLSSATITANGGTGTNQGITVTAATTGALSTGYNSSSSTSLSASAGNISVTETDGNQMNLQGTYAANAGNVNFSSAGNFQISNVNTQGNSISITDTAAGGLVNVSGPLTANAVNGAITMNAGTNSLTLVANLTASQGISLTGAGLTVLSGSTLNATGGDITIHANPSGSNISADLSGTYTAANGNFSLTGAAGTGTLKIEPSVLISGNNVSIAQNGTGTVTLAGTGSAGSASAVQLTALNGSISINSPQANLQITTGTLSSNSPSSPTSAGINIRAAGVTDDANTTVTAHTGDISITSFSNANVDLSGTYAAPSGQFIYTSDPTQGTGGSGNVLVTGNVSANAIAFTSTLAGANIQIGDAVNTLSGQLSSTAGSVNINAGQNNVGIQYLSSLTAAGDINVTGGSISTDTGTHITTGVGNIAVANGSGAISILGTITANGGNLSLSKAADSSAANSNVISGALTANSGNVSITTSASATGGLAISSTIVANGGAVTVSQTGSGPLTLSGSTSASGGAIAISSTGTTNLGTLNLTGSFTATNGALSITSGSSGTSLSSPLTLNGTFEADNGNLTITQNAKGGIALDGTFTTNNSSNGSVNPGNVVIVDKQTSGTDAIVFGGNAVTAFNVNSGNFTVQNYSPSGAVQFSPSNTTTIHASATDPTLGFVNVYLGATTPLSSQLVALNPASPPSNVTINSTEGGQVFVSNSGSSPAVAFNGATTLNAYGRNITLFIPASATGNITFAGGQTLTADPPVTTAIPLATTQLPAVAILASQGNATATGALVTQRALPTFNVVQMPLPAVQRNILPVAVVPSIGLFNFQSGANLAGTNVTAARGSAFGAGNGSLPGTGDETSTAAVRTLQQGAMLIAASEPTAVRTPFGTVTLAKDAVAIVISESNGLHVYVLDDTKKGSVVVSTTGGRVALAPGRHLSITRRTVEGFEDINPIRTLGYRQTMLVPGTEARIFVGEFDVMSAIRTIAPVRNLVRSPNSADRRLSAHMLKTAAILATVWRGKGAFQLKLPRELTASASVR